MTAAALSTAPGRAVEPGLPAATRRFYRRVLAALNAAGVPFLVGGGHALEHYLGIGRTVKDLDLFMRERDVPAALEQIEARLGYRTEMAFPHWLAKIMRNTQEYVDVIFSSGNAVCAVDDDWFRHAVPFTVMGQPVALCPPEEMIWSKAFIMERERYDGADIAHLFRACAETLDWGRLVRRFGSNWRVLLSHLVLFGFIYPSERRRIPEPLMRRCLQLLEQEMRQAPSRRICRGPLTSRAQYLADVQLWGYEDARLSPHGSMTEGDASTWTAAIDEAASRPIGVEALADTASSEGRCAASDHRPVPVTSARAELFLTTSWDSPDRAGSPRHTDA
ncbi:MAG TPA: nucleotidyltransferase [Candidatus Methylomirabilis sp.]|nr:nucleotidyltransferase [Candidatus Methylomirabilis sp.]